MFPVEYAVKACEGGNTQWMFVLAISSSGSCARSWGWGVALSSLLACRTTENTAWSATRCSYLACSSQRLVLGFIRYSLKRYMLDL